MLINRISKKANVILSGDKYDFALLSYSTENIGDEIQSIAANRFLPKINYYINRDTLSKFKSNNKKPIKLIMNGWYMMSPENWPPIDKCILPLLTSIHIAKKYDNISKAFRSKESIRYLSANSPVGARDRSTLDFLKENHIESYLSGCLTLTLNRNRFLKREDYILAVDLSQSAIDYIRKVTDRRVVTISVYHNPNMSQERRIKLAKYYLYCYQSAHIVISTRLHAILPSLAFRVPVVAIKEDGKYEHERFDWLSGLVTMYSLSEFKKEFSRDKIENPAPNKKDYLIIRKNLINICKEFTGYNSTTACFSTGDIKNLYKDNDFMQLLYSSLSDSGVLLSRD